MFAALQPLLANLASLTIALVNNADGTIMVTVTPYGAKRATFSTLHCLSPALPLSSMMGSLSISIAICAQASNLGRPTGCYRSDSGSGTEGSY